MNQSKHLHPSEETGTGCPVTSKYGRTNLKTIDGLLWVLKKIFDLLYHDCEGVALMLDGLQFVYTSGMSTIQCAYGVSKTLYYY